MSTLNFTASSDKITADARQVIAHAGGWVETTLMANVSLICLPTTARVVYSDSSGSIVELSGGTKLVRGCAWEDEDCTLALWEPLKAPVSQDDAVRIPIIVKAQFIASPHHATLSLQCAGSGDLVVSAVHEGRNAVVVADFSVPGKSTEMTVHDQESLMILVRHNGHILASGIYEVSLRQAEQVGVLLVPCVEQGIVLTQNGEEEAAIPSDDIEKIVASAAKRSKSVEMEVTQ